MSFRTSRSEGGRRSTSLRIAARSPCTWRICGYCSPKLTLGRCRHHLGQQALAGVAARLDRIGCRRPAQHVAPAVARLPELGVVAQQPDAHAGGREEEPRRIQLGGGHVHQEEAAVDGEPGGELRPHLLDDLRLAGVRDRPSRRSSRFAPATPGAGHSAGRASAGRAVPGGSFPQWDRCRRRRSGSAGCSSAAGASRRSTDADWRCYCAPDRPATTCRWAGSP